MLMKPLSDIIVAIKGAGEMASAVAWRLHRADIKKIYLMETGQPLAVRRRVCFSEAIRYGTQTVEGVGAVVVSNAAQIYHGWRSGRVAVAVDPAWKLLRKLSPDVCIDAMMAKRNLGTTPVDAAVAIGLGPGFQAPDDAHMVILGDIDPRYAHGDDQGCCATISDKARAISGSVLEAILRIFQSPRTTPLKPVNVHGHFTEHDYSTSEN